LLSDGADLPVFGIKITAYLHADFRTDHSRHLRFGMRGKGLTKRPGRPQNQQHSRTTAVAPMPTAGAASSSPQSDVAGEMTEGEP
jgi:hypothetical protein